MIPFTVLHIFFGSDYVLPGSEEQEKPEKDSKEEQPYFITWATSEHTGFNQFPSAA